MTASLIEGQPLRVGLGAEGTSNMINVRSPWKYKKQLLARKDTPRSEPSIRSYRFRSPIPDSKLKKP